MKSRFSTDDKMALFVSLLVLVGGTVLVGNMTNDMDVMGLVFFFVILPISIGLFALVSWGLDDLRNHLSFRSFAKGIDKDVAPVNSFCKLLDRSDGLDIRCEVSGHTYLMDPDVARTCAVNFFAELMRRRGCSDV